MTRRAHLWTVLAIVALAAVLRLARLGESPPGLNVDEAVNAWNAYCLLTTGTDQHGVNWPIFDSRGFGQGMTTLYLYLLIPFQAVAGLTVASGRLPAAFGGIATVLLLYYVGRRLFGSSVGLVAAGLLAVNPWHLQQSRWGHMGSLFPLLVVAPLAALLWAGFLSSAEDRGPSPLRAAAAGAIAGLCGYGYFAARLFLPIFLAALVLVTWRSWRTLARTRRGVMAIAAFGIAFAAVFGPLVLRYAVDPQIAKRAEITWVWSPSDPIPTRVAKVLARYPGHFGPDFLFLRGDPDVAYSPPRGYGLFLWYTLPLILIGLFAAVRTALSTDGPQGKRPPRAARENASRQIAKEGPPSRSVGAALSSGATSGSEVAGRGASPVATSSIPAAGGRLSSLGARVLLGWVLVYPAADLASEHPTLHALRSLPGVCALTLLAALGAVSAWSWLRPRFARASLGIAILAGIAFIGETGLFLHRFFGAFNREPQKYHVNHIDLIDACAWLRPRLAEVDAVYCTGAGMSHPYVYTLVALGYDPRQWFQDEKDFRPGPLPNGAYEFEEIGYRYGKIRFMIAESRQRAVNEINAMMTNGRADRVVIFVRPGELDLDRRYKPVHELRNPEGRLELEVFDLTL